LDEDEIERLLREVEEREGRARPEDELPDDGELPRWDDEGWD
jgi:hypothetical protein